MITSLHTDTYYRGYRLSEHPTGKVTIRYGTEVIDLADSMTIAHRTIDDWQAAR